MAPSASMTARNLASAHSDLAGPAYLRGSGLNSVFFEEGGVSLVQCRVSGILFRRPVQRARLVARQVNLGVVDDSGIALKDGVPGTVADLDRGGCHAPGVAAGPALCRSP